MIPLADLPADNAKLANLDVDFPRLDPDTPESCPEPLSAVVDYLRLESPDGDVVQGHQLKFIRTAQVADRAYWIWSYQEADGSNTLVTVAVTPDGTSCIGYEANYYGLTPEQFMLGDYYQVF